MTDYKRQTPMPTCTRLNTLWQCSEGKIAMKNFDVHISTRFNPIICKIIDHAIENRSRNEKSQSELRQVRTTSPSTKRIGVWMTVQSRSQFFSYAKLLLRKPERVIVPS